MTDHNVNFLFNSLNNSHTAAADEDISAFLLSLDRHVEEDVALLTENFQNCMNKTSAIIDDTIIMLSFLQHLFITLRKDMSEKVSH